VDIGDRVKKDSVLFTLDDQDLQTERFTKLMRDRSGEIAVGESETGLRALQTALRADKTHFSRNCSRTHEHSLNWPATPSTGRKGAPTARHQLTKTKILAPFDCTVLTRPVSVGQAVSGSGGFNSGTKWLTIANLNEMVINAHINQADVTRLKIGQQVEVQVEAVAGLKVNWHRRTHRARRRPLKTISKVSPPAFC